MREKDAPFENRSQIRQILMQEWDPIGVSDVPEAADEYDLYIDNVHRLIERGRSAEDIATYLRTVEVEQMGLIDERNQPLLEAGKRLGAALSLKKLSQFLT